MPRQRELRSCHADLWFDPIQVFSRGLPRAFAGMLPCQPFQVRAWTQLRHLQATLERGRECDRLMPYGRLHSSAQGGEDHP